MTPLPLLVITFVLATCGLIYELLAGSVASYLLGDSITQFSTVIGVYLSALGVGSYLSKFVGKQLARRFIEIELVVALLGGISAPLFFIAFARMSTFQVLLYGVVAAIGVLGGLEIPLLLRLLKDKLSFKELVARVLSFDYVGGLLASLAFPLILVPRLGLVRTSLLVGALNAAVALASTWLLRPMLSRVALLRVEATFVLLFLFGGIFASEQLTRIAEEGVYADPIVFARSSPHQRIVITRSRSSFQLFIDGNLQFSSADEYRYHEALVHPALSLRPGARRVLVLGGGDGLAMRELLRYPSIEHVTLVDLDPAMTDMARTHPLMRSLNEGALDSPKVEVINDDAYVWLNEPRGPFDAVIVDFPDPNNLSLGKLYTTHFYRQLRLSLTPGAPVAVQSTSPLMSRASFWCIVRTMEEAGFEVRPYHAFVPSFGEWGYALALDRPFEIPDRLFVEGLRYLSDENLSSLFVFAPDMDALPVETNHLNNQSLVQYYEADWRQWN